MLLVTTRWQHSITYWAMQVGSVLSPSPAVPGCRGSQGLWDSGEPGWNSAWLALHVPDRFPTPRDPLVGRGSCCSAAEPEPGPH